MARPQEFDKDEVLDRATQVFWQKGFDDTSIQDLVAATGLNRGSLYNSFGDKAEFFAAVMDRYRATSSVRILAAAPDDASPRQLIVDFLDSLVHRARSDIEHKGCLFTNTAAGLYGCDDAMTKWIRDTLMMLEDILTNVVERGQERGEIPSVHSARSIARFVVAAAQGINVMARVQPDPQVLVDIVDNTLCALGDSSR